MAQQQQPISQQRQPKTSPITDDFEISNTVLGLGINGKVVQCSNRQTGHIYALKVKIFFDITVDYSISDMIYLFLLSHLSIITQLSIIYI